MATPMTNDEMAAAILAERQGLQEIIDRAYRENHMKVSVKWDGVNLRVQPFVQWGGNNER